MDTIVTTIAENSHEYSEEVSHYADLINKYGVSTVIISVFIVVLFVLVGYLLRNSKKTNDQVVKQQQELLNLLMEKKNEPIQIQQEVKKEPDLVQKFLQIDSSIKNILKEVSEELQTSRLSVYVFHNNVYSSHGLPFFKTSCICEIIKKNIGVCKTIGIHTNLPLQMFDNSIANIYKNGKVSIVDIDDATDEFVHDSPVIIGMLKNNNIKSATSITIYDHDNNMLGILIAEFCEQKDEEFLESVEKVLIYKAGLLAPILEYSGIYQATNK